MKSATLQPPGLRQDVRLIGLVGLAHGTSHFSQLLLAPLFPWLKAEFGVGYVELGFLLTIFFVVSCAVQTASGFVVDRFGPRPVLFGGLALLGLAALAFASSHSYALLALSSVLAGVGNGVFHPVDFTLLNRKVGPGRLGHAYSMHGITGNLGWALAPALLVPITLAASWRLALLCAALLIFTVLLVLWLNRQALALPPLPSRRTAAVADAEGTFDFLRLPAVWMCFGFFFFNAGALSIVQSFAPEAARALHAVPAASLATCLTAYMLCAAGGMLLGGFLASAPERCERVVAAAYSAAAALALVVAWATLPGWLVPVVFGAIGFSSGIAGPSRDLLVKSSTPDNATGRVYGVVYAGLDIGQSLVPLLAGMLMDHGAHRGVWTLLAAMQMALIASAFSVRRARRTHLVAA